MPVMLVSKNKLLLSTFESWSVQKLDSWLDDNRMVKPRVNTYDFTANYLKTNTMLSKSNIKIIYKVATPLFVTRILPRLTYE